MHCIAFLQSCFWLLNLKYKCMRNMFNYSFISVLNLKFGVCLYIYVLFHILILDYEIKIFTYMYIGKFYR
mgnify:CR=1 FL=1